MKHNLIKKLALSLALSSTITLSACSKLDMSNLTSSLSADGKVDIVSTQYVFVENSKENNYISFIGHYDTGSIYIRHSLRSYHNHKDYRITYQVSKEDFAKVNKFQHICVSQLEQEEIDMLETLVNTYDPIEVKLVEEDEKEIHQNFNEEYRFNEDEYFNNLN